MGPWGHPVCTSEITDCNVTVEFTSHGVVTPSHPHTLTTLGTRTALKLTMYLAMSSLFERSLMCDASVSTDPLIYWRSDRLLLLYLQRLPRTNSGCKWTIFYFFRFVSEVLVIGDRG